MPGWLRMTMLAGCFVTHNVADLFPNNRLLDCAICFLVFSCEVMRPQIVAELLLRQQWRDSLEQEPSTVPREIE